MVVQAVYDFRDSARDIFIGEGDLVADIGEDITREALDRMGTSTIPIRLFGKVDYKKARYIFHPEYMVRQALFVDSKAEKTEGKGTATIQLAQTSMSVRQYRAGKSLDIPGKLPEVIQSQKESLLTTTIFVKYNYRSDDSENQLVSITLLALPNGVLQERYNPSADDSFWLAGRNAPSRGEAFRVRVDIQALKKRARWRVQEITLVPNLAHSWDD